MHSSSKFQCEQGDLLEKLKEQAWFSEFIKYQYQQVVFSMEEVAPVLSDYWMAQAHYRWTKDVDSVRNKEFPNGGRLDHFKQAGFLCYWLRRCPPLCDLAINTDTKLAGIRYRKSPKILLQYGNVFAAFDIGLRIVRYFEAGRADLKYSMDTRRTIRDFSLQKDSEFLEDICYTLAEKNISPHSLNMLYRSLFASFRPQKD